MHNDENFQIQHNIDCSSLSFINNTINKNDKRDYSYTLFRSSSVYVTRQLPSIEYEQEVFHSQSNY